MQVNQHLHPVFRGKCPKLQQSFMSVDYDQSVYDSSWRDDKIGATLLAHFWTLPMPISQVVQGGQTGSRDLQVIIYTIFKITRAALNPIAAHNLKVIQWKYVTFGCWYCKHIWSFVAWNQLVFSFIVCNNIYGVHWNKWRNFPNAGYVQKMKVSRNGFGRCSCLQKKWHLNRDQKILHTCS